MAETIYHVEGYNSVGSFISKTFKSRKRALEFWGDDSQWQEGHIGAEIFEPDRRRYEAVHDYFPCRG